MNAATLKAMKRMPHRVVPDGSGGWERAICLAGEADNSFVEHTSKMADDAARKSRPENIRALAEQMIDADDVEMMKLAKQLAAIVLEKPLGEAKIGIPQEHRSKKFGGDGSKSLAASHDDDSDGSFVRYCESQARLQRR